MNNERKYFDIEVQLMIGRLFPVSMNRDSPKFREFLSELKRLLDLDEAVLDRYNELVESERQPPVYNENLTGLLTRWDEFKRLLDSKSSFDWVHGYCFYDEMSYRMVERYIRIAGRIRPDEAPLFTAMEICNYLSGEPALQMRFQNVLKQLETGQGDPRRVLWNYEQGLIANSMAAANWPTPRFRWELKETSDE
jgi:hypothetical protein